MLPNYVSTYNALKSKNCKAENNMSCKGKSILNDKIELVMLNSKLGFYKVN